MAPAGITTSQSQLPVIYFIHGAWHSPEAFQPSIDRLKSLGYGAMCSQLQSAGTDPGRNKLTHLDDAAMVRQEIQAIIEDGRDVAVVCHSYGGIVCTEACAGLGKAERNQSTSSSVDNDRSHSSSGVISLLYVSAFILPVGNSVTTALGGELPPYVKVDQETGLMTPLNPSQLFYHDLPPSQQQHYSSLLRPHSVASTRSTLTRAAYTSIPTTFLYCTDDQAIPLAMQRAMVTVIRTGDAVVVLPGPEVGSGGGGDDDDEALVAATSETREDENATNGIVASSDSKCKGKGNGKGFEVRELSIDASHSPFLSQTDRFVDLVIMSIPVPE